MNSKIQKIMITGAPSSGKSSTLMQVNHVFGSKVAIVPESAVVLLSGGFPPPAFDDMEQNSAFQRAIIQVQKGLEIVFANQHPNTPWMILDRGLLDGAGFWPKGPEDYLKEFNIDPETEFARYDFVLFFELPHKQAFGGINALRFHNYEQSLESEKRLLQVWSDHPRFIEIKATENFDDKIQAAISIIKELIEIPEL